MISFRKHVRFDLSILVIAIFIGARLLFIDVVPFWDSKSVTDCVFEALIPNLRPMRLNCHHPSMGYLGIIAIGQIFDLRNQSVLNLTNLILAVLALMGFSQILRFLFFSQKLSAIRNHLSNIELALMIAIFAFHPLFFAHSVNPNLDFAVTVFFILSLSALFYQKVTAAIIFMSLLIFSKETGLLLYLTLITSYTIIPLVRPLPDTGMIIRKLNQRLIALYKYYLPLGMFFAYYLYQTYFIRQSVFWRVNYNLLLNFAIRDPKSTGRTFTRLLQIFVLDFNWILSVTLLLYLLLKIIRLIRIKTISFNFTKISQARLFWITLTLCFLVYGYFIFLLNTYALVRYILPLLPMLLLFFYIVLRKLFVKSWIRIALLGIILLCFIPQTFKTIDPISNLIFGTIPFGKYRLLRMTRFVKECCGIAGQDQLAYNTEHLMINRLISHFYRQVAITSETHLIISGLDAAELFTPADTVSFSRTLNLNNIIVPTVFITDDLPYLTSDRLNQSAFYVFLPWNDVLDEQLQKIARYYQIGTRHEVNFYGYTLEYYPLIPINQTGNSKVH